MSFGIGRQELAEKQDTFQPIVIGPNRLPGLMQTFEALPGYNPREQVFLILHQDEAFAFSFITDDYDAEIEQIFARMITSIDMCR